MSHDAIRAGFHSITPYLVIQGASALIDFLKSSFAATEVYRNTEPNGLVKHAELQIGDSMMMLADAVDGKPMPTHLHFYVHDTDLFYQRALQEGATSVREPQNTGFGERVAGICDPCGNYWWISTPLDPASGDDVL